MTEAAAIDALLMQLAALGAGDFSTFAAVFRSGVASLSTAKGSPNDSLCSILVQQGWMTCCTHDIAGVELRQYEITSSGHQPIGQLLALHAGRKFQALSVHRTATANDAMAPIVNGLVRSYVDALVRQVFIGGGDAGDMSVMLMFTVARCVKISVPPEQQEEVVRNLFESVIKHLKADKPNPANSSALH